jgi:hypothetical protein
VLSSQLTEDDIPTIQAAGCKSVEVSDAARGLKVLQEFSIRCLRDWMDDKKAIPAIQQLHERKISVPTVWLRMTSVRRQGSPAKNHGSN